MALFDTTWYVNFGDGSTTGYYAVSKRPQNTAVAAGILRRQFTTPAISAERVFVCVVAGTTANTTDATWTTTRGAKSTDGTATWQECTGAAAVNGDVTNTPNWTTVKNSAVTLGQIIKRNNGASYQICSTAGTAGNGSEPSFSDTAGTTTADGASLVWTSLGAVGNFSAWGAPHARLGNAFASNWGAAGNTFYVASAHAETQSSAFSFSSPGTDALPCSVLCVNAAGSIPPSSSDLTTGASVSATGSATLGYLSGSAYNYGLTFKAGSGANNANLSICLGPGTMKFESCALQTGGTSGGGISIGSSSVGTSVKLELVNTTIQFANATGSITPRSIVFEWRNTASAVTGATLPTTLLAGSASSAFTSIANIFGVDLSALGSGKTIVGNPQSNARYLLQDCKLNASVTITATPATREQLVDYVRCDSAATNYVSGRFAYEAMQSTETTIVRSGGASDGATAISWKIATTANASFAFPFAAVPIAIWNPTTAANVTVTVYGTWNSGAVPNNDDIWIEAEYLGASGNPLGSLATSAKTNIMAASGPLTADGASSWGGGGSGAGWSPFKLSVTLSNPQPAQKGPIAITVKAAKASSTFYIDPLAVLS